MGCPRITLKGVTAEVLDRMRERASSLGINLPPGDAGTARHPLAKADYAWDEITHTLVVTFTRRPPLVSCGDVEARVRHAAALCGAA